jgi:hypothetical protein
MGAVRELFAGIALKQGQEQQAMNKTGSICLTQSGGISRDELGQLGRATLG